MRGSCSTEEWWSPNHSLGVCVLVGKGGSTVIKIRGVGRWFGKGGLYRSIGKGSMISVYKIEPRYVTIRKHRGAPAPGAPMVPTPMKWSDEFHMQECKYFQYVICAFDSLATVALIM